MKNKYLIFLSLIISSFEKGRQSLTGKILHWEAKNDLFQHLQFWWRGDNNYGEMLQVIFKQNHSDGEGKKIKREEWDL